MPIPLSAGTALGQLAVWDGTNWVIVAVNPLTIRKFLRQVGDGVNATIPVWDVIQAGDVLHNILSSTHGDTLSDSIVAGDILIGNAANKLARLAKGADGKLLIMTSGLPAWADPDMNVIKWGGTALTPRDITPDIKQLSDMEDVDKLAVIPKAKGKTSIYKSNAVANGVAIIHTVTAGKTFYLCGAIFSFSIQAANVIAVGFLQVDTGGDGAFINLARIDLWTAVGALYSVGWSTPICLAVPLPFVAGTVFRVNGVPANTIAAGSIWGWEE